ncbi:MAG: rod shape-determining protein RodA [Cytophagales bacterium]
MMRDEKITNSIDWTTVFVYITLVIMGWLNVYAAVHDPEAQKSIFDLSINSGKQLMWIGASIILIVFILLIDYKFWETLAYVIYGLMILVLIGVLLFGKEVAGSKSWFEIGSFRFQPAEFAKFATALAFAKYSSGHFIKMSDFKTQFISFVIIGIPITLIMLQGDTGTAMVFSAFVVVMFLEGMSPLLIIIGLSGGILLVVALVFKDFIFHIIGFFLASASLAIWATKRKTFRNIFPIVAICVSCVIYVLSVDYVMKSNFFKPHQKNRINSLIDPEADFKGAGWNVIQSKIAIGSGGFLGKGFLNGTQTKFDFVPEQSTDFIFCTIGEEHGWLGSLIVISLFVFLMFRISFLAERQKTRFAKIYGYCVVCILFFHFLVNIGMTIGLFPIVGIPLPFFSYGGSSLWSFTILLFIFLNLDTNRKLIL